MPAQIKEPNMSVYLSHKIRHLFVYGTLKKGHSRHQILDNCRLVGTDRVKGYLFHNTYFPILVLEDKAPYVYGEVYELPEDQRALMGHLDGVEGVPELYWRLPVMTFSNHPAWCYFMSPGKIQPSWRIIESGKWDGEKTPHGDFQRFMIDNPDYRWPTKPKTKFIAEAGCMVVQQYKPNIDSANGFLEVYPTDSVSHQRNQHYKPYQDPRPARSEVIPPMLELSWLEVNRGGEECPETRVDGI